LNQQHQHCQEFIRNAESWYAVAVQHCNPSQEVKVRLAFQGQGKKHETLSEKQAKSKRTMCMVQVVEQTRGLEFNPQYSK
jgi:hypothetical protein